MWASVDATFVRDVRQQKPSDNGRRQESITHRQELAHPGAGILAVGARLAAAGVSAAADLALAASAALNAVNEIGQSAGRGGKKK